MERIPQILAKELGRPLKHIENVISLLDEGNTIPFIARYRKEMHGTMDDTALRTLEERLIYLRNLAERRSSITKSIEEQGKLTEELKAKLEDAATLAELEDLYRPYKPKRRTRATIAKEKGLEPLALALFEQSRDLPLPEELAAAYVSEELGVPDVAAALQGAKDIIAEMVSDSADSRQALRELMQKKALLIAGAATEEDSVYSLYYDFRQVLPKVNGHQILAINRGEREGFLKVAVEIEEADVTAIIEAAVVKEGSSATALVREAAADGYQRLIAPSLEREMRNLLTDTASDGAIHTFALNLKPLLMQPPVKGHVTLGFDPAYRTGCKIAVVDGTGKVLATDVVYPTPPHNRIAEAEAILKKLIRRYKIEHIAIGNGTASRESEKFIAGLIADMAKTSGEKLSYMIVNEAGASVYSASALGAEEFPEFDVSLRSAVSIARRMQDPLAELVKIDPRAIGVGQYQHDMPQNQLSAALDGVVEDCVNAVGVDLNTASPALLAHVSGLNSATAKNIVTYREDNGAFRSRAQLLKVPKLGPKAYQQCAGFLRVPEAEAVLDRTGVHPESYAAAERLLHLCGYTLADAAAGSLGDLDKRVAEMGEMQVADACSVGLPTLRDIIGELQKPGRDPREELPPPLLSTEVMEISDLKPGMILNGTVRNVVDFGAFVDIGVHQDGLVHISQICDKFLKHPSEALAVGDIVKVKVLEVDEKKQRISLSIRQAK